MLLLCVCQADLNHNMQDDPAAFYGVTSQYESSENMTITCSTKVCSFGKQVVEKVEVRTDASGGFWTLLLEIKVKNKTLNLKQG